MKVKSAKFFLSKTAIPLFFSGLGGVAFSTPNEPAKEPSREQTSLQSTSQTHDESENEFLSFVNLLTNAFRLSEAGTVEHGSNCGGVDGPCF